MNTQRPVLRPLLLASALAALLAKPTVNAASDSWNVDASGNWDTVGSWLSGTQAPGSTTSDNSDVATFSNTLTAGSTVTVDATRYIGGIDFGNTSLFGYTLSGGSLILNNSGVIQTLAGNGDHTDTISSPITISGTSAATAAFTANATSASSLLSIGAVTGSATTGNTTTLTLNGTNTGANAITGIIGNGAGGGVLAINKSGTGTWTLNGANTFTGAVTISEGQLNAGSVTGFGAIAATANLTLGSAGAQGILNYTGAASSSARNIVVGGAGGGVINSTTGLLTLSGTVSLASGPLTIGGANNITIGSATATNRVSGTNALTKTGAGTLTLSTLGGNVAISGAMPINVQAGTLNAVTTNVLTNNLLGTGLITITPGATLGVGYAGNTASTLANSITIAGAAGTANINNNSGAVNFNVGAVTFEAGSTSATILKLNNTNGTAATLTLGGTITGTGTIQLNPSAGGSPITLSGAQNQTGTISNVGTSTSLSTLSGTIGSNISGISQAGANPFTVSASVPLSAGLNTFTSTGAGLWTFSNASTFTGTQPLTFNANSAGGITVSGTNLNHTGTITNSGSGAGTTTISSVIGTNVTGVTQNSATSQLTLSNAANTFTSAITVTQGQLNASSVTGFGSATATSNVNLGSVSTVGTAIYTAGAAGSTRPFVVGGAAGGQLLNNGSGLLTLTAAAPILNLASGPLTIGGSANITVTPAALAVPVTGGNTLTKIGAGTVTLNTSGTGSSATISGATPIIITAGTLQQTSTQTALAANSLGTGLIKFNPVNTGTATLGMSFASVVNTYSNTINVDAPATGTSTAIISVSAGATFSGPIVLGTGAGTGVPTLRFTNTNGALFTVTATGGITGTGHIVLNGTGNTAPITLSGTNPINITGSISNTGTNAAAASVATISAPITTTNLTAISQQGASPFTISSSLALTSALNSFTSTGAGLWTFSNANTFTGAQNLTFNANSTGGITVSGTNLNHTGTVTNSGTNIGTTTISSSIGSLVSNITQNSATSALILSGTNTYTGSSNATNGLLQFNNVASLPNFGTGIQGAINVGSGGILGLGYAGANQFTQANITSILDGTIAVPVNWSTTGSSIGLDTGAANASYTPVIANPSGATSFGLVKLGTNTLTLGNGNTFSGPVEIRNGTLSAGILNSVTTAPVGASSLGVPGSAANGTISLGFGTTTGTLSYTGAGETTDRVINLAGSTGGGGIDNSGGGTLTFTSPMTFTGTGAKTLTVSGASNTTFGAAVAGGGVGSTSPLTIAKTGAGTLLFGAPGSTINSNTLTTLTIAGGVVDIGTSGLTLSNSGLTVISSTANAIINATGGGVLTISSNTGTNAGDIRPAAGTTLTINANISTPVTNTGFWTAQGGGLELNDAGTLVLTGNNSIAGVTSITAAGTISVGNIAQNLGGTTGLLLNTAGSRLLYTGTGETTTVPLQPNANSTVEQAGPSGTLNFSANWATGASAKTVTLQGSTAGLGVMSGIISNNSGTNTTGITKAGTGTWTLSGANTYTGATTVSGGNLILSQGGGTGVLGNTGIVINSGGTLSPLGGTSGYFVGNTATAAAGGRVTLNSGGTLNLADGVINPFVLIQNSTFAGNAATFAGGSIVFDISATAADQIDVRLNNLTGTGLATSSGSNGISFNPIAGSLGLGNYTLINAAGTLNNSNFFLASPNLVVGGTLYNLSLSLVGTKEILTVATGGAAATPGLAYWKGTTDASWALGSAGGVPTNWAAAPTGAPDTFAVPGSTTNVSLAANTTGPGGLNTTLDQAFTVNSLTFTGTGTANTAGATIASGTGTNALTINAAAVNGNTLGNGITVLAGSGANAISADVILGNNQTWTNNSTNALTVSGVVGDGGSNFALTTAGAGAIILSNANTYGGATTINAGMLSVGTLASGGSPSGIGQSAATASNLVFGGNGTLQYTGPSVTINRNFTINTGVAATFDVTQAGTTLELPGATGAATTGALTKIGAGALTLSGANTYTGNTVVARGTLNLPVGASLTGNGITNAGSILNVGTVAGQNAVVNVSGGNINTYYSFGLGTVANSVGVLNLSGGSYNGTGTQTNNSINFVGQGGYGYLNITGGTFVAKGRFAPSNGVGTTGVMYIGGTGTFDHTAGEWFLMAYSASGNGGLSQVTVGPGGTLNRVGASQTFGLNMDRANGYAVFSMAGGQMDNGIRAIAFGNGNPTINTTGILNLAGGTLTLGVPMINNPGTGTGNTGYLNFAGGTLRTSAGVAAIIPASSAGQSITSRLHGSIDNSAVSGAPSFVGGLTVDTNGFNSSLTNALLAPAGVGVRQADLTLSGGAGYVGAPAVQFSKPAVGGSPASGYALISGGQVTGIVITSPGDYTAGEVPTVTLTGGGASSPATVSVAALNTAATSGGLTKIGAGTLTLSGANTYTGVTTASFGTLQFANQLSLYNNTPANWTASKIVVNPGATLALNVGGAGQFTATDVDTIKALGTATGGFLGGSTLGLDSTGASFSYGTAIGDTNSGANSVGLAKLGTNTLTLTNNANSYTGPTTIFGGILSVAKIDVGGNSSGIGASTSNAANLVIRGGTLQYTGTGDTTDRNYTFGNATTAAGGGIDTTGATGPLVISGSMTGANVAAGTQVLTLTSLAASGANALNGSIVDSSVTALTGVTKAGAGAWTLGGANTYTGATTISAGTLQFAGSNALNGATQIGMAGATTLQVRDDAAGTINHTANNITVSSAGTVTLDVGNNGGATTGSTVALGALKSGTGANALAVVYNFTGANGYLQSYSSAALPGTTGNNTTYNPTTTSVVITGNVTSQMAGFANTNYNTLFLDGTSTGNAINGVISDAVGASPTLNGLTRITKQNTSTWTLNGVSTYRGITTIGGGTLKVAAGGGLANTAITVNPVASGSNPTFAVTPGTGTIDIGSTGVTALGATLVLNPGTIANPVASSFSMQDNLVGTVNLKQEATFAGNALTLGAATAVGYVKPSLNFDIGGTSLTDIDLLNVTKLATVGTGGIMFNFAALTGATSLATGNYTFLTSSGGLSVGGGLYTLGTPTLSAGATTYSLSLSSSTATAGILTITALAGSAAAFWEGDIDGSWNSPSPGTDTNFATSLDGSTDTLGLPDLNSNVTFTTTVASNLSTTLDANFTINSLAFNGTGTSNAAGSTIASGTGTNTLTINALAVNGNPLGNGITVGAGSGPNGISANVALGASQRWTVAGGTSLAVSGDVSGTGFALTLPDSGTVTLSGNNSYSGGTNLNAGKLVINSPTAIGTGPLSVVNATIDNTTASPITLSTNNTQTWANNGALAFTGTRSLNLGTGAVTFGDAATANFTISNAAASATQVLTIGGPITGGAGGTAGNKTLTVAGTGDIVLSGNITKGAAISLDLTVTNTGNVSLAGTSTIRTLNANGGPASVINLTAGSLTLSNGGSQTINSTGGTINGPGSIALSGTTASPGDNGVATGATLTINAQLTGATTDFEFWSATQFGTFVLTNVNNNFANLQFNVNGAVSVPSLGNSGSNGPAGRGAISFGGGGKLIYTGTGETSNKSINMNGTTAGPTLDQSGPSGNLLLTTFGAVGAGSKTLTLQGSTAGTGEISAVIANNSVANTTSVTKRGSGTWTLSGANTYTGATTVSAGTLTLSGARTATTGVITVGNQLATTATLNISNGTFTTGQFSVGSGDNPLTAGIVNQTGGTLTMSGTQLLLGNGGAGTAAGSNSTGTYNLSQGTLNTIAGSTGVLIGVNTGTTGVFNLSGTGVLAMPATSTMQIARSDDNTATNTTGRFSQTGGIATVGILRMGGSAAAPGAGGNATLNLTGGTFSAVTFDRLSAGTGSTSAITIGGTASVTLPPFPTTGLGAGSTASITFDGGTLKNSAASSNYLGIITAASIKAGGATFDTTGGNVTITQNLLTDLVSTGGGLTKTGINNLTLTGANTYTGTTTVSEGTLLINGTTFPAGLISVTGTATLGGSTGTGQIGDVAMSGGTSLRPGNTEQTDNWMTVGDLTLDATTKLHYDLEAPTSSADDFVEVLGTLTLAGELFVNALTNFDAPSRGFGDKWLLATYAGAPLGSHNLTIAPSAPALSGGLSYAIDISTANEVYLAVVPEAGTAGLVALGLLLLRRRCRR